MKTTDIPVDHLEFSVRTLNILKYKNIKTLEQLCCLKESQLLSLPNFGRKSLNDMKNVLRSIGREIGDNKNMECHVSWNEPAVFTTKIHNEGKQKPFYLEGGKIFRRSDFTTNSNNTTNICIGFFVCTLSECVEHESVLKLFNEHCI